MSGITPDNQPAVEAALAKDGIWVAPAYAGQLTAADLQRIHDAAAATGTTTYVVVTDVTYNDPNYPSGASTVLASLHDDLGGQGIYLLADPSGSSLELTVKSYPQRWDADDAGFAAADTAGPGLADQIVGTLQWIKKGGAADYIAKPGTGTSSTGTSTTPTPSGSDHTAGIVIAVVVVVACATAGIGYLVARRRRPSGQRGFRPSRAVLANVRAAEDRTWAERAQAAVLALGEAIDAATMPASPSGAWQAALDHYDAARRLLDRAGHPAADDIGALVLAGRGSDALAAAQKGRDWSPSRSCYFNPLHGAAKREVRWDSVEVPACARCAKAIGLGQTPDDVLDLIDGDTARHYFQLDVPPWSQTGYGALDTDLLAALLRR